MNFDNVVTLSKEFNKQVGDENKFKFIIENIERFKDVTFYVDNDD